MPASFLKRHRTICEVLEEIREVNKASHGYAKIEELIDEAKLYAERMSIKLHQYKEQQNERK